MKDSFFIILKWNINNYEFPFASSSVKSILKVLFPKFFVGGANKVMRLDAWIKKNFKAGLGQSKIEFLTQVKNDFPLIPL